MKHKLAFLLLFSIQFVFGQKISLYASLDSLLQLEYPRKFNGNMIVSQDGNVEYYKSY